MSCKCERVLPIAMVPANRYLLLEVYSFLVESGDDNPYQSRELTFVQGKS